MEKTFTFTLSEQETNLVLGALAEMPFKLSNSLIQKLVESANAQQAPKPVTEVA